MITGQTFRRVAPLLAALTTLTIAGCGQSPSGPPLDLATPKPPPVAGDLLVPCPDPGLSGDKGQDAINHRRALAVCEARRSGLVDHIRATGEAEAE